MFVRVDNILDRFSRSWKIADATASCRLNGEQEVGGITYVAYCDNNIDALILLQGRIQADINILTELLTVVKITTTEEKEKEQNNGTQIINPV